MKNSKADKKNISLVRQITRLRSDIDLYRLIGLNASALKRSNISNAFLAHIQNLAHVSIALGICRIFEDAKHNELDSIPDIIESLPNVQLSSQAKAKITAFGLNYGNCSEIMDPRAYLRGTLGLFIGLHSPAFAEMKRFRDKVGAHSESKIKMNVLPSLAEFEAFYSFAEDFYDVISEAFVEVGPARISQQPGKGFMKLMKSMGIDEPQFDFEK